MKNKYCCIIPARQGSKRIKNKNIILINKKPIISYSILTAKKTGLFKKIIVSTDSNKIAKIAKKYGAEVPYLRSKKLSDDKALSIDVLIDTIKKNNIKEEYVFFIYATNPLLHKSDIIKSFKYLKKLKGNCLISAKEFQSNPLRMFEKRGKDIYYNFKFKKFQKKNSQDLKKYFYDAGSFYIFKTQELLKKKNFLPSKIVLYKLKKYSSLDLNDHEDLSFLKILLKYNLKNL
jgi:CMP-N-acetylneuraminic acid synthetase